MKHLFIHPENSIKEAMKKLSEEGEKCLLVVGQNEKLLGTLSDGDVRKAILKGKKLNESIEKFYNINPSFLREGQYTKRGVKDIFLNDKFDLIPVLNDHGKVVDLLTWSNTLKSESDQKLQNINIPVVIMAGGRGTRMEPFTKILPKPLIPIQEKPVIEHIIERFNDVGCNEFYMTLNYKGRILRAYFEELQPKYDIEFIEEKEPLGTAGSLRFFKRRISRPFFVTNCDSIIKADYDSLYEFHEKGGYDITLVASTKDFIIPYGTCELNGDGYLSHINEKPKYEFLVNTGLYVLNPDVLELIPKNKFYHITHLIEDVKNKGKKVGVFPIDEDAWIDIGQWTEYRLAVERL